MTTAKEIRTQIKSIKSTQKITRAMEMVAASKMRKAQDRMRASRPYSKKIKNVIQNMSTGRLEYEHPYFVERTVNRVGYIVISTDRGLCGGLNINLFKSVVNAMQAWNKQHIEVEVCAIGKKAEAFFKRFGGNLTASISNLGDKPQLMDVFGTVKVMLDAFDEGKIDSLYLIHNVFLNTMSQKPITEKLLPIDESMHENSNKYAWDYIYEPAAKELIDSLLRRYIESLVYQGLVENIASEQAARMVAMKSATENAGEIITSLQLLYNKARQASITRELSEIVAGAAAV
jgi:F-type H+-transporting ATPase subunit gamma